ncbi:MAG TPA: acyltransferase domain-containing protein [Candidatus Binatia bacterium]|nr:acyltransferase domain-containing protein [Candidatus Binatia bacterium]
MSTTEIEPSIAIGFPGQGASNPEKMRRLITEHPIVIDVLEEAEATLEEPVLRLFLQEASSTATSRENQIRLYLGSSALWRAAEHEGVIPDDRRRVFFGASAGEYAALMAAGAYDFSTGLEQIELRGEEMQKASIINPGAMLVATGLPFEEAEKLAGTFDGVYAVNDNPGMQTVFSGSEVGLAEIAAYLGSSETWSHVRLDWAAISEAAHSIHMAPAVAGVQAGLKKAKFKRPTYDFVGNRAKAVKSASAAKNHLAAQLTRGVLLRQSAQYMKDEYNVDTFVDVGPGKVLYAQMRHQFRKTVQLISVMDELLPEKE